MTRCKEVRTDMLAFMAGELDTLRAQRVQAHLSRCPRCSRAYAKLSSSLAAARVEIPKPTAVEVEQLVQRMGPYLTPRRDRFPAAVGASVALVAASLAAIFVRPPEIERMSPSPGIRVVAQGDLRWPPGQRQGELTDGWAVLDAPLGTRLELGRVVLSPAAAKTRFWVERTDDELRFGVERGALEVRGFGGLRRVEAGPAWQGRDGQLSPLSELPPGPAVAFLADPYLPMAMPPSLAQNQRQAPRWRPAPRRTVAAAKRTAPRRLSRPDRPRPTTSPEHSGAAMVPASRKLTLPPASADPKPTAPPEPAATSSWRDPEWRLAERWAREGQWARAERAFATLERRHEGTLQRIARLERARILGLRMSTPGRARAFLADLVESGPDDEIARQAKLTICELDRSSNPCDAQACLRELESSELSHDAARLLRRWNLEKIECPNKKHAP